MPIEKRPQNPVPRDYVPPNSKPHRVHDGESWVSLARQYGKSTAEIIYANFKTLDPAEINWYLRSHVGCELPTPDHHNWMFSSSAKPGVVHIPAQMIVMPPEVIVAERPNPLLKNVWLGVGVQSGGRILFGIDSMSAAALNLGDPLERVRYVSLIQEAASIGLGLGGSGGAVALFAYGIEGVQDFNAAEVSFDFAVDPGVRLGAYLKSLKEIRKLKLLGRMTSRGAEALEEYKKLKSVGENLIKNGAFAKPGLFVLPIPGGNWGVDVWAGWRASETKVHSSGTINFKW